MRTWKLNFGDSDAEHVIGIRRMFANELEAVSELHQTSLRVLRTSEFTGYQFKTLEKYRID